MGNVAVKAILKKSVITLLEKCKEFSASSTHDDAIFYLTLILFLANFFGLEMQQSNNV